MRRRRNHSPTHSAPVPEPVPVEAEKIIEEEHEIEAEENMMPFVIKNEDKIINYIKDKATKETLKSLSPLLEKLEEAVREQQAYQANPKIPAGPAGLSYEEQLKKLQDVSKDKIKEKELKVAERMLKLQARINNTRK